MWIASCITALIRGGGRGCLGGGVADAVESTFTAGTYFCGEDCVCRQNVSAGAQSPVGERSPRVGRTSPIRRRWRGCAHGAPGVAKDPGASTAVEAMARFCGETILPRPPPMVLAASRIFGSRPAPWAAVACRLANRAPVVAWAAPGDGPRQRAGSRPAQRPANGARRRDRPAALGAGPDPARPVRPAMPARTSATA